MTNLRRLDDHRTALRHIVHITPGKRYEIHIAGEVIVVTCRKVRGRMVDEYDLPPGGRILRGKP